MNERTLSERIEELIGKPPSEEELEEYERIQKALGLRSNDAIWIVIIALQRVRAEIRKHENTLRTHLQAVERIERELAQTHRKTLTATIWSFPLAIGIATTTAWLAAWLSTAAGTPSTWIAITAALICGGAAGAAVAAWIHHTTPHHTAKQPTNFPRTNNTRPNQPKIQSLR